MSKLLSSPLYVAWDATYKCNLSCKHCCFGDRNTCNSKEELSTEEAKRMIDELSKLKIISFQFAGGEPMLRNDFIELVEYVSSKNIVTSIATNGLFINKEIAAKLKKIGIATVQVSLDGANKDNHEFIRGKDTFDNTVKAIQELVNQDIPVLIATFINKNNIDRVEEIVEFAYKMGVKNIRLQFLLQQGNAVDNLDNLIVSNDELESMVKRVRQHPRILNGDVKCLLPCFYANFVEESHSQNNLAKSKFLTNSCGAGTCSININPYGDITACGILTDEKWNCGNIREDSIEHIWNNSDKFDIWRGQQGIQGKCSSCNYLSQCMGGCRASAFLGLGSIKDSDPLCWR